MKRLAFDIGGTFTDFVYEDDGTFHTLKVPTTPEDPAIGVIEGMRHLGESGNFYADGLDVVLHATTVATNAIIERKGGRTALITTDGFRDVLIIGRQKRYETYDLYIKPPKPLVQRRDIFEVVERVAFDGETVIALDMASLDTVIDRIAEANYDAVAVALLHAYAAPDHERQIRDRLYQRLPDIDVSISSEVSPKFREYERTNTTVANSYVKPIVSRYVTHLEEALSGKGFRNEFFIMQSSGGLVSPEFARNFPIRIVESGPAAGVLMARDAAAEEGFDHVIAFDMGGTTAKLGAVDEGVPSISPTFEIDPVRYKRGSGLPINTPAVELLEIGAGGGSIARAEFGTIAVGPESAGAKPGPVCYGLGSDVPTVTDANLVLGYLDPEYFNDGAFTLDIAAARDAIQSKIAKPLDLSTEDAAWGIHLIATNNMEHAIRIVSVERGRDPRRYAMVAFGGAGPLHAARLARKIGVPQVIIPKNAGVGSAVGLLGADARLDASATRLIRLKETTGDTLRQLYKELEKRVRQDLDRMALPGEPIWSRFAYMRFSGQGFEIHVPLPAGPIDDAYPQSAEDAFRRAYATRHQFSDTQASVEAVDWYLVATIETAKGTPGVIAKSSDAGSSLRTRPAFFPDAGGWLETRILNRGDLVPGNPLEGPAIVADPDSTAVIPPGDIVEATKNGHLVIRIGTEDQL